MISGFKTGNKVETAENFKIMQGTIYVLLPCICYKQKYSIEFNLESLEHSRDWYCGICFVYFTSK